MHYTLLHFAYLDPGTGSMIIQSIIGITAGVGLFGRRALNSIRSRIKSSSDESTAKINNKD